MIDTKSIKKEWDDSHWGSDDEAVDWYISVLGELLDSHDELERKLKITEDKLEKTLLSLTNILKDKMWQELNDEALKQIRGE